MVIINNKEFPIYDLDNKETILNRIASNLNTLKKFLYFPNGEPDKFDTNDEIKVEDIFQIIKDSDDFETMYNYVKDKHKDISLDEIIKIFIIYNKSIYDVIVNLRNNELESYIYYFNEQIQTVLGDKNIDIAPIIQNISTYKREYTTNINKNIKKVTEEVDVFKKFKNKKGIPYEPFELEVKYFEMKIENKLNLSILEIFNNIKLTEEVPFASCLDFYKIRQNHIPHKDWIKMSDDIILKVLENKNKFTDVRINNDNSYLKAILEYNIKNTVSENKLIKRYTDALGNYSISESKEKSIKGVFYFPNQRINKYIFSDLILNNKEFSQYIGLNEHVISSRDSVYIYFNIKETGPITALLTEQIVDKKNPDMKRNVFIEDSYCIRVKISIADNINSVLKFQDILSKLFVTYNAEYNKIFNFYSKFIPESELEIKHNLPKQINDTKTIKFRDNLAPELYIPNYTSFCGYPPTLIKDEDEDIYKDKGYQVLTFPKDNKIGFEPRKYICDYEIYKNPGVRVNTLTNSDKFEYLPCCYKKDQRNKANYKRYYNEKDIDTSSIKQNTLKSNKLVDDGQLGFLPQEIEKFFNIIDNNIDSEYYRHGVAKTKNSFLQCVFLALNITDNVEKVRKSLDDLPSCKQEMYDYTFQDIINKIQNLDEYFDPKLFVHLIELKYNCNIILFKRDNDNPDGILNIPRHIKGYFKNKTVFDKCIFIYENIDQDENEQCELICKWNKNNKKDELERSFNYDSYITQKALNIFYELNEFYILRKQITYIDFPFLGKLLSQSIDNNGKTRKINIEYDNKIFTLFTSPLQPYNVKEVPYFENNILNETTIINFLTKSKATKIKNENNIISCVIGNVQVYLKLSVIDKKVSYISEYNKYKKLSRYITQYFFWLYSKYISKNDNDDNFKKTYITIKPSFIYGYVSNIFILDSGLMQDSKLVLKSEEVYDRLYYLLQIQLERDPLQIIDYKNRTLIENYYFEISDFTTHDYEIILRGEDALLNFIFSSEQNKVQYILHNEIQVNKVTPYFFKNKFIDGGVYLAQNTENIENAITIYKTWQNNKYNPSYRPEEDDETINQLSFVFYAYKNKDIIEKYYIKGKQPSNAKIIGYKMKKNELEEYSYFTVLLQI